MSNKKSNKKSSESNKSQTQSNPIVKIGLIIAVLLTVTVAFGAFATWSNSRDKTKNIAEVNADGSLPVLNDPILSLPNPTPNYASNSPVREYVYGGGKQLAVLEPTRVPPTDLAVWRISTGTWYVKTDTGYVAQQWGNSTDRSGRL
jgi:hypothetical protein